MCILLTIHYYFIERTKLFMNGNKLEKARIKAGMSREALAREADVSSSLIYHYERGGINASYVNVRNIALALAVATNQTFNTVLSEIDPVIKI